MHESPTNFYDRSTQNLHFEETQRGNLNLEHLEPQQYHTYAHPKINNTTTNAKALGNCLPIVEIKIGNTHVMALVDSGAAASLISKNFYDKIKNNVPIKEIPSLATIRAVTNEPLDIFGHFQIPVNVGLQQNERLQQNFYIVNGTIGDNYSIILGIDFLRKNGMTLNFKDNTLVGNKVKLDILDSAYSHINKIEVIRHATLIENYTLKPKETIMIDIKIQSQNSLEEDLVIFPILRDRDIEINPAIVKTDKKGITQILISNLTMREKNLTKHSKVAEVFDNIEDTQLEQIRERRRQELKDTDFKLDHLNPQIKGEVLALLKKYADVFSTSMSTIGNTNCVQPDFSVRENELKNSKYFPVPQTLREILKDQLDEMVHAGIIEPSSSYITFPLVMVKKKKKPNEVQAYRICIDFRGLNKLVSFNQHPLPLMNAEVDKISGSKFYSSVDLNQSFFQVALKDEQKAYTAFQTPFGTFQFKVLPMGASFAPATLQKLSDKVLAPLKSLNIANFIDDYAFGAESIEEMLYKLEQFFRQLRKFNLTINPTKCEFIVHSITFLGFLIDKRGSRPSNENLVKIAQLRPPKNLKGVRALLGLCSYFRRYIKGFSEIAAPLTDLTKNKGRFKWSTEAQKAFEELKDCLDRAPVLVKPDFEKEFILSTDASSKAIGGCLSQRDERTGIKLPIAYYSKKLNENQRKYPIYELELLALTENIRAFKHYIYGRRFKVEIDNKALFQIKSLENPGNRVTRQILKLQEYDIDYVLVKSKDNLIPDFLSRQEMENPNANQINLIEVEVPSLAQITTEQYIDGETKNIIDKVKSNTGLAWSEEQYELDGELLIYNWENTSDGELISKRKIVIPKKYRPQILNLCHSAHFGVKKTYENLKQYFYWKGMYRDCTNFVESCLPCNEHKYPNKYAKVPLQKNIQPEGPLDVVSIDIVGPLKETGDGFKYILVVVDLFTRFVTLYALKTQKATEVADKLMEFIAVFGLFDKLLSDCATNFQGAVLTILASRLGVKKLKSTHYRPQTSGTNERIHCGMKKALAIFAKQERDWNRHIGYFQLLVNSQKHDTLGYSPYFVMYARHPTLPHTILPTTQKETQDIPVYVENRLRTMERVKKIVDENCKEATKKQQFYRLNQGAKLRDFQIGDRVMLHTPNLERSNYMVKRALFDGPYIVIKRHNDVNYSIVKENKPNDKPKKVHAERLLPYTKRREELQLPKDNNETIPKVIDEENHSVISNQNYLENDDDDDFDMNLPLAFLLQSARNGNKSISTENNQQIHLDRQNNLQENTRVETELNTTETCAEIEPELRITDTLIEENTSDSQNTEIYNPCEIGESSNTSGYNLRPRKNDSNQGSNRESRLINWLDWALEATK